jgi:hypothetical protein
LKRCPITYEEIPSHRRYSVKGLRQISNALTDLEDFPFTAEEQRKEAEALSSKLSIQGVQPKLSVKLNAKRKIFEIVDRGGRYIFKPQVERFKSLPENEDATMKLASISGIEVPFHGLIYSKNGSLTYFIRRFDRQDQKGKLHIMDEMHTPDSSRFWIKKTYKQRITKGLEPENFDKEFLRLWYAEKGYRGDGTPPKMSKELIVKLSKRYIGVYEMITGKKFIAFPYPIEKRIQKNVKDFA